MKAKLLFGLLALPFLCLSQVRTAEYYGMQANNLGFDNAAAFQVAIADHVNGNVDTILFDGIYNFDTTINLNNSDGLILEGVNSGRATFFTDNLIRILVNNLPTSNVTIGNMKFESSLVNSTVPGNNNALLYIAEATDAVNWTIDNCEFTAPSAVTNGIKVYTPNGNSVDAITVRNSYFHDLGRMGFETVNHDAPLTTTRVRNIVFENNLVERTGLIQSGMGISLSGRNEDCIIRNNDFTDNPNCAIEIVGGKNIDAIGNSMNGSGSAVHIVRFNSPSGTVVNDGIYLKENVADVADGNVYINAVNLLNESNSWISLSRGFIQGVDGMVSNGDIVKASSTAVFQVHGSSDRVTRNIRFDNSILESLSTIPIVSYSSANGQVTNVSINCSEVRIPSGNNFGNIDYGNTERYVSGNLTDTQNPSFSGCLPEISTCPDELPNGDTSVTLSAASNVLGLDSAVGAEGNGTGTCGIEVASNDSGEPWARYRIPIDLATNGIIAGDQLVISLDGRTGTGNARIEVNQNNAPNTALATNTFGTSWQTFSQTVTVPANINTIDIWLFSNYGNNSAGGNAFYDNLNVLLVGGNCPDELPNGDTLVTLSAASNVLGLDSAVGAEGNGTGTCGIEVANNDSGEPWARYRIPIDLATNGIIAGDQLVISLDGRTGTGNARIEVNQNNAPNTALASNTFGTSWQTFSQTVTVPGNISTLDIWLFSNYGQSSGGNAFFDNLIVEKVGGTSLKAALGFNDLLNSELKTVQVFPNPGTHEVQVTLSTEINYSSYGLYNLNGSLVKKGGIEKGQRVLPISVYNIEDGIYLLKLSNEKGERTLLKLIKE